MSRELKRVSLDFSWPLNKVWIGYLNPYHGINCPHCDGSCYSPEAQVMHAKWYGKIPFDPAENGSTPFTADTPEVRAFAERNVIRSPEYYGSNEASIRREAVRLAELFNGLWMHHLSQEDVDALFDAGDLREFPERPTAEQVNRWTINPMNDVSQWIVMEARCKRMGVSPTCSHCEDGTLWPSPEVKKLHDTWEKIEPAEGIGYQIWETVTEGSPITPVFETPEELAEWAAANPYGADDGTTKEQWLKFILGPGWAPSAVGNPITGELMTGVQAIE